MKVKFSKALNYVPDWEGNSKLPPDQQFHVVLNPVKFADMLAIREGFAKGQSGDNKEADPQAIFDLASDILPRYATINGLEDDSGPVTIADISSYPMFLGLAMELLVKISQLSVPTLGDQKNSQPPQD